MHHYKQAVFGVLLVGLMLFLPRQCVAGGGELTFAAEDETNKTPAITRFELWRGGIGGTRMPVKRVVPAGIGVVLDRNVVLAMPDGPYSYRLTRGPEYRVVTGKFSLEPTSKDDHVIQLPRIINMREKGWTSGDCCVVPSANSLPLRMASEDLHFAFSLGEQKANPIPHRKSDDMIENDPAWIRTDAAHRDGLVFYGMNKVDLDNNRLPVEQMVAIARDSEIKIAIENPFAWQLPVWLASQRPSGMFLFGDWLRLDRKVLSVKQGRAPKLRVGGGQAMGHWGEEIYRHVLDAGFRMPPLAGGGSDSKNTPVGYNRLYVGKPFVGFDANQDLEASPVQSAEEWWDAAWQGHSVATNGPMLRPRVNGELPGHVFKATAGETIELQPELNLAVRDKVEYLEVVHNNRVDYSAPLDDFARAGGILPKIQATESGWVMIRVVTLHENHYRAAVSAPWYIEFDGKPRVSKKSVQFFQEWLGEYEKRVKRLAPVELKRHAPFVRAARKFWADKSSLAVE